MLNESAVAIRTKAMKSLSAVISADPSILSRVSVDYKTLNFFLFINIRIAAHKVKSSKLGYFSAFSTNGLGALVSINL